MLYTKGSGKRRPEEMGKKRKKVYCTDGREKKMAPRNYFSKVIYQI
jgi:hypothetical protein